MLAEPINHFIPCGRMPVRPVLYGSGHVCVLRVSLPALLLTGRVLFAKNTQRASDAAPVVGKHLSSGNNSQGTEPAQIRPESVDGERGRDVEDIVVPQRDRAVVSDSGQGLRPHGKVSPSPLTVSAA